jgi:hypothetical protein
MIAQASFWDSSSLGLNKLAAPFSIEEVEK